MAARMLPAACNGLAGFLDQMMRNSSPESRYTAPFSGESVPQAVGDGGEVAVAGCVPVLIVDGLEGVEVEQADHADRAATVGGQTGDDGLAVG